MSLRELCSCKLVVYLSVSTMALVPDDLLHQCHALVFSAFFQRSIVPVSLEKSHVTENALQRAVGCVKAGIASLAFTGLEGP